MNHPFIIWSLPRSGSTTLLSLAIAAGADASNEPFSNKNFEACYRDRALKEPIAKVLDDMFVTWNGFKHTADPSGWPFPDNRKDINDSLLMVPGTRFVFLERKNKLKRVVSSMIAQQCGLWNCHHSNEQEARQRYKFSYLDIEEVGRQLETSSEFTNRCRGLIEKSGNEFMSLTMESLIDIQSGVANNVLSFLGLKRLSEDKVKEILSPLQGQQSDSIYSLVPELMTVEWTYGGIRWGNLYQ